MRNKWELYRGKPRLLNFTDEIMELHEIGYSFAEIKEWIYINKKWKGCGLEFCTSAIRRIIGEQEMPIPEPNVMIVKSWTTEGLKGVAA